MGDHSAYSGVQSFLLVFFPDCIAKTFANYLPSKYVNSYSLAIDIHL